LAAGSTGFADRSRRRPTATGQARREIVGDDGAVARLDYFDHDPLGLVLVRRGGYAVGRVRGGRLVLHKVGTALRSVAHGGRRLVAAALSPGAATTRPTSW
jgi:hypothetical protein